MLGNFHPSHIEEKIYNLMEDYEIGTDIYDFSLTEKLVDWFTNLHIEFQLCCSEWPNGEGGVCSVAFVEEGFPHLIVFDYYKA